MTLTQINREKHFITRDDEKIIINHVNALVRLSSTCGHSASSDQVFIDFSSVPFARLVGRVASRSGAAVWKSPEKKNTWRLVYLVDKRKLYSGGE